MKFARSTFCKRGWAGMSFRPFAALLVLAVVAAGAGSPTRAFAATEAEAAQRPPLNVQIFVNSRSDDCYDSGELTAIKRLATDAKNRINLAGGVAGRKLQLIFLDNQRDQQKTIANVAAAVNDPQTLAMVGLSNPTRAKAALDAVRMEFKASAIPLISDISVNSVIAEYPTAFTTRPSEDEERMPVIAQFVKQSHFSKPAFFGLQSVLFSSNFGEALKKFLGDGALVGDRRLELKDDKLDDAQVAEAVADLKAKNSDLVFLSVGGDRAKGVIKQFKDAGFTPAIFITGNLDSLSKDKSDVYPNDIYQLAWDGFPQVYSDRLRKLISSAPSRTDLIFEGDKNSNAPGWKNGQCKPRDEDIDLNVLDTANMRALAVGTQYADIVSLIAEAARPAEVTAGVPELRGEVVRQLLTTYASGRGTFKGQFNNWSFQPSSRAASRTPLIVVLQNETGRQQLAQQQFAHLRHGSLRRLETLYADIDLVRVEHIDDNDKTFFAEFYLSLNDRDGASIDQVEFSNAYLEPGSNDRQVTTRVIHDGGESDAFPSHTKIYEVSGKFMYEPRLAEFPFDTQRFSIDIQPKHGNAPFILQPPPADLRDRAVTVDGWSPVDQYVGYDEDFVRTVDAQTLEPSVAPFYRASFVWLMKRETTDYFLRVVVPLAFILIIAYLSIFISSHHFEAIVTIQVTALLSAVALYLSLPKLDANAETLSDRIFLFSYLILSIIIGITIVRANKRVEPIKWLRKTLALVHIVALPALVASMAVYVYNASLG